jgi:UDP-glucose 4-epimerase
MAKYLITGGCGFIGSLLTRRLLAQQHEVVIIDNLSNGNIIYPEATLVKEDITQLDNISEFFVGVDGCFHLAAVPIVNIDFEQWFEVHNTNLQGSLNVFKAAIDAGNVPVVYASSCSVYGNKKRLPLTENQFIRPLSSYGCDKLSTELNANFLAHTYQLPSMGLRFFNVYGPYQQPMSPYSGVITHFITSLLENKPLIICGDGEQTRDFVFVEDIVDNLIHAMKILKRQAHIVNICTESSITINELAELLSHLFGKKCVKIHEDARPDDVKDSCGSQKKMKKYGFKINYKVKEGLLKTVDYFKSKAH